MVVPGLGKLEQDRRVCHKPSLRAKITCPELSSQMGAIPRDMIIHQLLRFTMH
jgi:hypothetical protein